MITLINYFTWFKTNEIVTKQSTDWQYFIELDSTSPIIFFRLTEEDELIWCEVILQ